MKICLVSQIFRPQAEGGAEISARLAARALARAHSVTVLSLGRPGDPVAPPGLSDPGEGYALRRLAVRNSYLPSATPPSAALTTRIAWHLRNLAGALPGHEIRAALEAEAPDVLYANNSGFLQPALFRIAADLGIPIVFHIRDYSTLCPRASMYRNARNCAAPCAECRLRTRSIRQGLAHVGTAIAVSGFVRRRFQDAGVMTKARWHVLHNTNMDPPATGSSGRTGPAPGTPFTIGYLGAISPDKGIDALIAAVRALAGAEMRLLIGGRCQGDFAETLRRETAEDPRIAWLGWVAPDAVFAQADMIAVPSLWHEPQSRILVEAAIRGLPVIASSRGGSPEIVGDGRTGWLFDPDEPGALGRCLERAVTLGRDGLRTRAPELFPGLTDFAGTAEATGYHARLAAILEAARRP